MRQHRSLILWFQRSSFSTRSSSDHQHLKWNTSAGPLYTEQINFPAPNTASQPNNKLAIILHGLLGAGKNLRSFTDTLLRSSTTSNWTAVLVDLRCHGKSSTDILPPPHTLEAAARDVIETVNNSWHGNDDGSQKSIDLLVGHSLGGKIALEIGKQLQNNTQHFQQQPPKQIWVLDSMLGKIEQTHNNATSDVKKVLDTVSDIPLPIPSREWLYDYLEKKGFSKGLALWLGSSLILKRKNEYAFTFDVQGASSLFHDYMKTDSWSYVDDPSRVSDVHIVRAERSDRWDDNSIAKLNALINNGRTYTHVLANAGHWVHVDNPQGLVDMMKPYIID